MVGTGRGTWGEGEGPTVDLFTYFLSVGALAFWSRFYRRDESLHRLFSRNPLGYLFLLWL